VVGEGDGVGAVGWGGVGVIRMDVSPRLFVFNLP